MNLKEQMMQDVSKVRAFLQEQPNAKVELTYSNVSIQDIRYYEEQFKGTADYLPVSRFLHLMGFFEGFNIILHSVKHSVKTIEIVDDEEFFNQLDADKREEDYKDYQREIDDNKKENLNENIN